MRALFVINNPVFGGGTHNELLAQRDGLSKAGWEIIAITPDERATGLERLREAGVDVTPMPLHRVRATLDPRPNAALFARFVPEVSAIRRVIRERSVDLVQVHGLVNAHGAVAARLEGVAVGWHIYDTVAPMPLRRAFMPLVLRLADSVCTWGRAVADVHPGIDRLGPRLVITPPAVDLDAFRARFADRQAARAELGISEDAVVVGTVGNRNPSKGHLQLVEVARRLAPRHPRLVVCILGGLSPAHAAYEAQLQQAAAGMGDVVQIAEPGLRVPELAAAFDVFALTSVPRSEGMPAVVVEAMSCGLPVVATDVGAVREQVLDGMTGRVVQPNDVPAFVDALEPLLNDRDLRTRYGDAGRERALSEFSLDRVVAIRLRAFEIALEHRRAR